MTEKTPYKPRPALRVALIFPPAMSPTIPPLGIASLRAYLDSNTSAVTKNFDLNLAYCEQALDWVQSGRLKVGLKNMDYAETARRALAARDFFRGNAPESFFDPGRYDAHARTYIGFGSVLDGLFDSFCRKILVDAPVPPLVRKFFDELIRPIEDFRPDVVGFSILFSQQLFFALALAKLCRKGGAKTVFGGATFSVMPDPGRLLSEAVEVRAGGEARMAALGPLIDFLIVGEGEAGMKGLVESLRSGGPDAVRVPGLVRAGADGISHTPPEAAARLDGLPVPDFSDFSLERYHSPLPVLPYLSSRGCPWRRCAFCTHQRTYLDYREESAAVSAEKIAFLQKTYGVAHFGLVDEMIHPFRLDRLARRLSGAGIFYSAYARPAGGFTPDVLSRSHESGLRVLMWGVESGSGRVLDLMRKGTKIGRVGEILGYSHAAGIWNLAFVIFGFPTETAAEWRESVDFLQANRGRIDALSKSRFVLLEGSDIHRRPEQYGISRIIDREQKDPVSVAYDFETVEGLTQEEISRKFRESLPLLDRIGRSPHFGRFRDHMLIFASRM